MTDMLQQIRSLGDQLRWALEVEVPDLGDHRELLYAGMGGSGISGDYASAMVFGTESRVAVHKGYAPLPGWAGRLRPLFVAASYSGNTEETLDSVGAAADLGLNVVAVTTGGRLGEMARANGWATIDVPSGLQPRAAAGYMIGSITRIMTACGALPDQSGALGEAIALADRELADDSTSWAEARNVANGLASRIPIIYGGGPVSGTVAQRWKTQFNENAKIPAWWSVLPELDHNEVTGWETLPELTRRDVGIVSLTDAADHSRVEARLAHTSRLTEDAVPWVGEVASKGDSTLARLVSLTIVGDLTSLLVALDAGVDPVPVETIEKLKRLLIEDV
jgi:glucose/mannose-6-phosphate isomerase